MNKFKKWNLVVLFVFITVSMSTVAILELLLWRANESLSIPKGITFHASTPSLYGRSVWEDNYRFKKAMVQITQPDILALGTSRVMQIRKDFFKGDSFYNAGGGMPSLEAGIAFVEQFPADYTPKYLIIGVDLWWFNPHFSSAPPDIGTADMKSRFFLYNAFFNKMKKRAIPISNLLHHNYMDAKDPETGLPAIGYNAARGSGFRTDGSYKYIEPDNGWEFKRNFSTTLERVAKGKIKDRFAFTKQIDERRLEKFQDLLSLFQQKNTQIIVFLPPFAHAVHTELTTTPEQKTFYQQFQNEIETICKNLDIPFFNFSDIATIGTEEETIDGFHGSERAYAKIVLAMATSKSVNQIIDATKIKKMLLTSNDPIYIVPHSRTNGDH